MSTSTIEPQVPEATRVDVDDASLSVELSDGRVVSVPIAWYPRLAHGTADERAHWRFIGCGEGVHWPDLDEDISIAELLAGKRSGESQRSFERWLERRRTAV